MYHCFCRFVCRKVFLLTLHAPFSIVRLLFFDAKCLNGSLRYGRRRQASLKGYRSSGRKGTKQNGTGIQCGFDRIFQTKEYRTRRCIPQWRRLGGLSFLRRFIEWGYKGALYPINPKAGEVLGIRVYPDLESLPEVPRTCHYLCQGGTCSCRFERMLPAFDQVCPYTYGGIFGNRHGGGEKTRRRDRLHSAGRKSSCHGTELYGAVLPFDRD